MDFRGPGGFRGGLESSLPSIISGTNLRLRFGASGPSKDYKSDSLGARGGWRSSFQCSPGLQGMARDTSRALSAVFGQDAGHFEEIDAHLLPRGDQFFKIECVQRFSDGPYLDPVEGKMFLFLFIV